MLPRKKASGSGCLHLLRYFGEAPPPPPQGEINLDGNRATTLFCSFLFALRGVIYSSLSFCCCQIANLKCFPLNGTVLFERDEGGGGGECGAVNSLSCFT